VITLEGIRPVVTPALGRRVSRRASERLDMVRAFAALAVMFDHLRGLFFVPFSDVRSGSAAVRGMYFLSSLGHQAVIVFFVLSGYFVGSSVLRSVMSSRWSWRWYLNQRLTRLWIVLVPALLIGGALDLIGISVFGSAGVYGGGQDYAGIVPDAVQAHLGIGTAAQNALFLQGFRATTFGSNGALWSLANEFWYYLAFPLLVFVIVAARHRTRLLAAALLVLAGLFVGGSIAIYFIVWLAGVAIFLAPAATRLRRGRWLGWLCAIGSVGACVLALLVAKYRLEGEAADFVLVPGFALLIFVLAQRWAGRQDDVPSVEGKAFKTLAGFSYTLYVIHLPILVFVRAWAEEAHVGLLQPTPAHVLGAVVLASAVVAIAYVVSLVTERNTDRARKWVTMHLAGSSRRLAASDAPSH
jgi:peptidoglycan/LPS O-acetylase OafA/YrhL